MTSTDTILYIALLFAFLVMGSILTFTFLIHQRVNALLGKDPSPAWEQEVAEQSGHDWMDKQPGEEPAVPLDPTNPPVPRVFNPSADKDPHEYPICNCHGQRLTAGEQIIWWPQPDGSVMIFHPDFISQAAKATA